MCIYKFYDIIRQLHTHSYRRTDTNNAGIKAK